MSSGNFWEDHYIANDTPWDKGAASPGLVDFLNSRPIAPGSACVPGCGMGHDVRAWAAKGLEAVGIDIAPSAVARAQDRADADGAKAQFLHLDFLRAEPPRRFDWVFEHTCFCAIQPDERALYIEAVRRWLKPGGHYLAVNYTHYDLGGPPFKTDRLELEQLFAPHFRLREEWTPRSYPNREGLELMLLWQLRS